MNTNDKSLPSNLDSLLDDNLDDLADLPEFKPYPAGAHKVFVTLVPKEIKGKLFISADFKYISAIELGDPTVTPPKEGAMTNLLWDMSNEYGQGAFKMFAKATECITGLGGSASRRQVIEKTAGAEVTIVTKIRTVKDVDYMSLVAVMV